MKNDLKQSFFYDVQQFLLTYWLLSNSLNDIQCQPGTEALKIDA